MPKTKRVFFTVVMVLIILIAFFAVDEIISRIVIGKRLIVEVEDNGLYHFKPNQKGWYSHIIAVPHAAINNIGARGQDIDINYPKEKYVFLGDSFTFGWELEDNATIPYYFTEEHNLNKNQVYNFGNGGYGIQHMIAKYNFHKNLFKEGDYMIMIIIEDDFYREMLPYENSFIRDIFWKIKDKSSFISWLWAASRHIQGAITEEESSEKNEDVFSLYGDKLIDFNKKVKEENQNLVYVFYEFSQTDYSINAEKFCNENDMKCIANVPEFIENARSKEKNTYAPDGGHPSSSANRFVAKGIASFIRQSFLEFI